MTQSCRLSLSQRAGEGAPGHPVLHSLKQLRSPSFCCCTILTLKLPKSPLLGGTFKQAQRIHLKLEAGGTCARHHTCGPI